MNKKTHAITILVFGLIILAGCSFRGQVVTQNSETASPAISTTPSATLLPTVTFTPQPTFTPTATPIVILDPEPIQVEFSTSDGQTLSGIYYPASENPAPIIVLVHGASGDQSEWVQIAHWLQNRGELVREPDYNHSWLSSNWFPENPAVAPIGVFTFTLRNCDGECQAYLPTDWLLDVEGAMAAVVDMQGVDRSRILSAGASIGADIAIYGCDWLNQTGEGNCPGSFSLSPASLTTIPYQDVVDSLLSSDPPGTVYCLYGLRDDASVETCGELPGIIGIDYGYIENHGLELFQAGQNPDPLLALADFIQAALAGEENEE